MLRHSLTRTLIPFQIRGTAPRAALHRQTFERFPGLVSAHFEALSDLPCPDSDRDALARAFQLVLDPDAPQRDVRAAYLEAEERLRFSFLQRENREVRDPRCNVQNPYSRLLYFELIGVATYYAMLYGVDGDGSLELKAGTLLKTYLTGQCRTDSVFTSTSLLFEALQRNELAAVRSGEIIKPEDIEAVHQLVQSRFPISAQQFISEMFLFERAVLGKYRFDFRGDEHLIFQSLKVKDVGHSEETSLFLYDPLVLRDGHIDVERLPIKNGRWFQYRVMCRDENLRVLPELPTVLEMEEETLFIPPAATADGVPAAAASLKRQDKVGDILDKPSAMVAPHASAANASSRPHFFVFFNTPLSERGTEVSLDGIKQELAYGQIFETANIDHRHRTVVERFFHRD